MVPSAEGAHWGAVAGSSSWEACIRVGDRGSRNGPLKESSAPAAYRRQRYCTSDVRCSPKKLLSHPWLGGFRRAAVHPMSGHDADTSISWSPGILLHNISWAPSVIRKICATNAVFDTSSSQCIMSVVGYAKPLPLQRSVEACLVKFPCMTSTNCSNSRKSTLTQRCQHLIACRSFPCPDGNTRYFFLHSVPLVCSSYFAGFPGPS